MNSNFLRIGVAALAIALLPAMADANIPGAGDRRDLDTPAAGRVDVAAFPKWLGALGRAWAQQGADRACKAKMGRDCHLARWQNFLSATARYGVMAQLRQVNAFVNATPYRSDMAVWGRSDYWAAPGEFFARGGDCEDYAVAKYVSLKQLGFDTRAMRILVLNDTSRGQLHAVLLVQHQGESYILDNLSGVLRTWNELPSYRPLYSVNEADFWLHPGVESS